MRIYLIGFMGCGKTTVGRALAAKLGWNFIDLDVEIEQQKGKSISAIFEELGEETFRTQETKLLESIHTDPAVVATGGGTFVHNRDWILKNGLVVYLDVPFDVIVGRIGANSSRPLWKNAEKLFEERQSVYRTAHFSVNASRTPEEVVIDICNLISNQAAKRIPEN